MGAQPGTPAAQVLYGEDYVQRMLENISRDAQERESAIVRNQAKVNQDLSDQLAQLADIVSKQVEFGSTGGSVTNFAVTTTMTALRSATIAVPDGYSRCIVIAVGMVGAWNGSASGGYLNAHVTINGAAGAEMPVYAAAAAWGTVTVSAVRTMTGLTSGSSITLSVDAKSATAWGTSASNLANLDAIVVFRR